MISYTTKLYRTHCFWYLQSLDRNNSHFWLIIDDDKIEGRDKRHFEYRNDLNVS